MRHGILSAKDRDAHCLAYFRVFTNIDLVLFKNATCFVDMVSCMKDEVDCMKDEVNKDEVYCIKDEVSAKPLAHANSLACTCPQIRAYTYSHVRTHACTHARKKYVYIKIKNI